MQNIDLSNYFIRKHKMLVLEGKVKTELNEKYKEKLAQSILYYDGSGWTNTPTMTSLWKNKEK